MTGNEVNATVKRFACGDVIPGCEHVFIGPGDQNVLDQVITHAATAHGLARPPISMVELVIAHTHPFTPVRSRSHLRLVTPATGGQTAPVRGDAGPSVKQQAHTTYRHECLLYHGLDDFFGAVIPFIRDGLARDEPVLVAVIEPRLGILRSALGPDAERVQFVDMAELGGNPARIIPAWREFTDRFRAAGDGGEMRPVRGVGEPIWAGRSPAELVECQLHEALLNLAVPPDVPLWLLCPYDVSKLDPDVIDEAHHSHPVVVEGPTYRGSTSYGGAAHVGFLFGGTLPAPTAPSTISLDPHRHGHLEQVMRHARAMGLPADNTVKLATAVDTVAAVGYQETGDAGITIWQDGSSVVCQITDDAVVQDPLVGRTAHLGVYRSRNRAIRLANELCDLVQVRSNHGGTTVRLHSLI
jgi:predicted small metal-binding protein